MVLDRPIYQRYVRIWPAWNTTQTYDLLAKHNHEYCNAFIRSVKGHMRDEYFNTNLFLTSLMRDARSWPGDKAITTVCTAQLVECLRSGSHVDLFDGVVIRLPSR